MPLAAPVTIADLPFSIFIVFPRENAALQYRRMFRQWQ
jgi:hypothetical protein